MGGKMSCLTNSSSEPKSAEAAASSDDGSSTFIKSKRSATYHHNQRRRYYKKKQHHKTLHQMQKDLMMSEDYSLQYSADRFKMSPGKKFHPSPSSSRHVRRRLISEAKDSMCLDGPMMMINSNCQQQEEGKLECLSVSGKEEKRRVRFKLPHVMILYSPEEEPHGYCGNTSSEESSSFYLTLEENCREGSFGSSPDEICFTLAVNTLPQASFSSGH